MSRTSSTFRLAVTGGGTGGHTYPALTTIEALRTLLLEHKVALQVTWYGSASGLEARVARDNSITFVTVPTGKVRRSLKPGSVARTILDMGKVPFGIIKAVALLAASRPEAVLSTGGYAAVPVGLAARITGRRLVMAEQITTLGLANRVLARGASAVALTHQSSLPLLPRRVQGRAYVTGNPVRPELLEGDRALAQKAYQLDWDLPLVYVTGGAQGSAQINTMVTEVLPQILPFCQVLHQCGPDSYPALQQQTTGLPGDLAARYHLVPYLDGDLAHVLARADLVVSRAGAGTLAELTAVGRPSILVPLVPTAAQEQRRNAQALVRAGAAVCLTGETATADHLRNSLLQLLGDPELRGGMRHAAAALGKPAAARNLAELIFATARGRS